MEATTSTTTSRPWLESQYARLSRQAKLTAPEELKLALAWQRQGDRAALSRLVEANLGLVVFTARKLKGYGVPQEELMAEGNLGLMRAADRFDQRGVRFRTYAAFWVRAFMLAYAMRSTSLVVSATGAVGARLFFKLRSARARLETRLGADPELVDAELARKFGLTVDQIRAHSQRLTQGDLSLDQPAGDEGESTMVDLMPGAGASPEQAAADGQRDRAVRAAVAGLWGELDLRERAVLERRLLADGAETTLADLGEDFGLSRERLRQIEVRLKSRLKKALMASPELTHTLH